MDKTTENTSDQPNTSMGKSFDHPTPKATEGQATNSSMDKSFDHKIYETQIYNLWEKSGAFTPRKDPTSPKLRGTSKARKPFTIIMPPPNANAPLHIGHARFVAIEDTLIRYHRMLGESALWIPGADHAGIETQFVFEKKLREKGQSRFDFDRETLYKMIWEYVQKNTGVMESQLKQLGASCDWSRFKFTLDPNIVDIVNATFKKFYDEGYVYRGKRIVNYCPRCGTNFSELEVDTKEQEDNIYYIDYGVITIATTRPETIFADVAIAVHPKDERYTKLIGKTAIIPIINREIPIIADNLVQKDFGSGALKITPAHDSTDFEIGQRHALATISVIDEAGRMTGTPEIYVGMKALDARTKVVEDLESIGKIKKTEKIKHTVGICYRDKGLIEPMISEQWFLKVQDLTKSSLKAIKNGEVKFPAENYKKIANHWLKNLRDWNLSRQIVWGIRIPAFRCEKCLEWNITEGTTPDKCTSCGHDKLKQDNDTFDTWFSSGQWPYATLQTAQKGDFEYFYPTSVMNTAYDILAFWVIRMIMLGIYRTGNAPFDTVLIHGLVRDREGQKISKSKGNVINPIEMVDKYGADSLRLGLLWGALVDHDISLSEEKIRGQRNFANKVWNVARFVLMESGNKNKGKKVRGKNEDDKTILHQLKTTIKVVTKQLDKYRLNEAAETLYNFFWYDFANTYLENTKKRRTEAQPVLEYVLSESLKLLHPFMPFVTETIWQESEGRFGEGNLISAQWPK